MLAAVGMRHRALVVIPGQRHRDHDDARSDAPARDPAADDAQPVPAAGTGEPERPAAAHHQGLHQVLFQVHQRLVSLSLVAVISVVIM